MEKTETGCCPRCKRPYTEEFIKERNEGRNKAISESFAERRAKGLKNGRPMGEARRKRDASILYLKNVGRKSQREIAQILGVSQGVVQRMWDKDNREKEIETSKI